MLSSLLLAGALSASIHISSQSDTLPKGQVPPFKTDGERRAYVLQQLFRDDYVPHTYPLFKGTITRLTQGSYRLDSFIIWIDTTTAAMTGLLSRGLLYPDLMSNIIFSSTDTFSIGNFEELKSLSPSPHIRRFYCWVSARRISNPFSYVIELTNQHGTKDMSTAIFIRDARLTYLHMVSIII